MIGSIIPDRGNLEAYQPGAGVPVNGRFKVLGIPTSDEYHEEAWQRCEAVWKVKQASRSCKRLTGLRSKSPLASDVMADILGGSEDRAVVGPVLKGSCDRLVKYHRQIVRGNLRETFLKSMEHWAFCIHMFRRAAQEALYGYSVEDFGAAKEGTSYVSTHVEAGALSRASHQANKGDTKPAAVFNLYPTLTAT